MTSAHETPFEPKAPAVLAVDVGGSHVKILLNGHTERRRFVSGKRLTAEQMVTRVLDRALDLEYDVVTVGVPAPVLALDPGATAPPSPSTIRRAAYLDAGS